MKTPTPSEPSKAELWKVFRALSNGKFNEACRLARSVKNLHPESRTAEWLDIVTIADRAEYTLTGQKRTLAIRPCIRRLVTLSKHLRDADPRLRSRVLNELYYFTRNFRQQVKLGRNDIKRGNKGGHYSIGVGATWHALSLLETGHLSRAKRYARIAKLALDHYIKKDPSYSNTYLQLSLTLEILGKTEESDRVFSNGVRRLKGDKVKIKKFFGSHRTHARVLYQSLS